jgi:hypothetical protein
MFKNITYNRLFINQLKYFSNIVFFITFLLIVTNSRSNILPLNILVFCGSIILFHVYPNYYEIVNQRNNKMTPFLISYDLIIHYLPLIYILSKNIHNISKTNLELCVIIVLSYLVLFHKDIYNIYFQPNQYFQ